MDPLGAKWLSTLLAAAEQGLADVSECRGSEVSFVRYDDAGTLHTYVLELERRAEARGFVTARLPIGHEGTFDSLDAVARAVLSQLRVPSQPPTREPRSHRERTKKRGLLALLDGFLAGEGAAGLATFDARLSAFATSGDLIALARAYLEAAKKPRREMARLEAWISGIELARADVDSVAVAALTPRTAKRALGELTRLVLALGHAGVVLLFTEADNLLHLSQARRDDAYTVLRELVDNSDSGRGLVATRLVVAGKTPLFVGPKSLASLAPLQTRVANAADTLPTPHRPMVDLVFSLFASGDLTTHAVDPPPVERTQEMRAIIRGAAGLPPTEAILSMSVGHEQIDRTIDGLFEHSAMEGSVFALLSGAYGSGKTHLLLHLAARARADKRPVLRLSLERLDVDLGNPQRHLRRMLEHAELPLPGNPSITDLLALWTRIPEKLDQLLRELKSIQEEESDASAAAARVLRAAAASTPPGRGVEAILGAIDLESKPNGPGYRQDAYGRLLLWLTLLERLEQCAGPVLLIDEAENLYKGGSSRSERRTALRALAFYCGGALPRACVVLAVTPDVLPELRAEARELLDEVEEQRTLLAWEDATMFRRRLVQTKPIVVPVLLSEQRAVLAARVRRTHAAVRRSVRDPGWSDFVASLEEANVTPRDIVRRTVERLEGLWWYRA